MEVMRGEDREDRADKRGWGEEVLGGLVVKCLDAAEVTKYGGVMTRDFSAL